MKALQVKNRELKLNDVALPQDGREAVVRVTLAGVCHTDLEIVRGYAGFEGTLGHEFVGVVESLPTGVLRADERSRALMGKRVVGEINAGCGACEVCRTGDARHCPQRTVLGIVNRDGAFADYVKLPLENLLVVPDEVSDRQAVFAEPLAAAIGISEQVKIEHQTRVCVIGDGKLGLLCALALREKSNDVTLIGKHEAKMRHAVGCAQVRADEAGDMAKTFDVVVEASGGASGFGLALETVKPRGVVVLKSTFAGATDWQAWRIVVDEIAVVGSRCGRFAPALAMLKEKKIQVEDLITDEFALTDGIKAFERAGEKGVLKVLLKP